MADAEEIRPLLAALRDFLDLPRPADSEGRKTRDDLRKTRVNLLIGVLEAAVAHTHPDTHLTVADSLQRLSAQYPVTYLVHEDADAPEERPVPVDVADEQPTRGEA